MLTAIIQKYISYKAKKRSVTFEGTITGAEIKAPIEILRDNYGVPHIYAQNKEDLMFAQGFIHSQERLWQMELTRRLSQGKLSEMIGKDALETDIAVRTLGLPTVGKRDAENFKTDEAYPLLVAYTKGVNFGIKKLGKKLPVEFELIKHTPEEWQVSDILTLGRFISFQMSYGWLHELVCSQLAELLGYETFRELDLQYPEQNPNIADNFGETNSRLENGILNAFQGPWLKPSGASNNWCVSPEKMNTGAAALANDPHLLLNAPNIWFENHISCPDYEASGVSLPGAPLVMIGHNRHIAWGATLAFGDQQDTYIIKFTDRNETHYEHDGQIRETIFREESIIVKGHKKPHIAKIAATHHGPIVSGIVGMPNHKLAFRSKALEETSMIKGFYLLNVAAGWDDFVTAVKEIIAPPLNLVYADTSGNVGYYMTGEIPVRTLSKSMMSRPGWSADYEWSGSVPFEEMPHIFNPKKGYVYTCNNRVVPEDYPHFLGRTYMNGYRANRLKTLFEKQDKYSLEDFAKWQLDLFCTPGKEMADFFKKFADEHSSFKTQIESDKELHAAFKQLVEWDGFLDGKSIGGSIYQVLKTKLYENIVQNRMDKKTADALKGTGPHPIIFKVNELIGYDAPILFNLLKSENNSWIKHAGGRETALLQSLRDTVKDLQTRFGNNISDWQWGKMHQITFKHPFGEKAMLAKLFNRGPFPLYGDTDTLCQTAFMPAKPYEGEIVAASYRMILDLGNWDNSRCIMPIGQSGDILSSHYDDQINLWLEGKYRPHLWSREAVERNVKSKMRFEI